MPNSANSNVYYVTARVPVPGAAYAVVQQPRQRQWFHNDIVWSFRKAHGSFPRYWVGDPAHRRPGLTLAPADCYNYDGLQFVPPWTMRRNEYVVDDYGNVVAYFTNVITEFP